MCGSCRLVAVSLEGPRDTATKRHPYIEAQVRRQIPVRYVLVWSAGVLLTGHREATATAAFYHPLPSAEQVEPAAEARRASPEAELSHSRPEPLPSRH